MPWSLERRYGYGDLHFITFSCYRRRPLFTWTQPCELFLRVLEDVRRHYKFVVLGYVVMPEHVHLLLSEPDEKNPSEAMMALKMGFAHRLLNARRRAMESVPEHPRVWEARFYDFNVDSAEKQIEKLRYIHRNPVKRGLVKSPELWQWSSFRAYAFGEASPVSLNDWSVRRLKRREPVTFESK
jgi:putative transposase